jgi:hypothetical protein
MSRPAFAIADHAAFVESLRKRAGTSYPALLARGESMTLREALMLVVDRLEAEVPHELSTRDQDAPQR